MAPEPWDATPPVLRPQAGLAQQAQASMLRMELPPQLGKLAILLPARRKEAQSPHKSFLYAGCQAISTVGIWHASCHVVPFLCSPACSLCHPPEDGFVGAWVCCKLAWHSQAAAVACLQEFRPQLRQGGAAVVHHQLRPASCGNNQQATFGRRSWCSKPNTQEHSQYGKSRDGSRQPGLPAAHSQQNCRSQDAQNSAFC